jgi:hypothetical protein
MKVETKNQKAGWWQRVSATDPYMKTLYVFNTLGLVASTLYGLYYGVFLYRHMFSLSVLAVDALLGAFGAYAGYLLGVRLVRHRGYGRAIRTSFLLWTVLCFGTAMLSQHIAAVYMYLAVLKGLPGGMYSAATDTMMLREVKSTARSGFFQLNLAIEFVASMVLPAAVGALISVTGGYVWAFVAAGSVYTAGLFVPCRLPKPEVFFTWRGMPQLLRRPHYAPHALNRTVANGMNQLNIVCYTIIPFLLLKSELNMGLLTSIVSVLAALVALGARRLKQHNNLRLGYAAYSVRALGALAFVNFWSAPYMMAWQLIGKVATPLHDPLQQSLDIHNDSLILGEDLQTRALQINVLNNTLALIGTTLAVGAFVLITRTSTDQQRAILQALIIIYSGWRFVNLTASYLINRWARHTDYYLPLRVRAHFRYSMLLSQLRAAYAKRALAYTTASTR